MSSTLDLPGHGSRGEYIRFHDHGGGSRRSSSTQVHDQPGNTWFEGGLPTPPKTKDMAGLSVSRTYPPLHGPQPNPPRHGGHNPITHRRVPSDPYTTSQPLKPSTGDYERGDQTRGPTIATHLQIPESVNSSKGSLAEFAAEITCLFWFESAATLQYAEQLPVEAFPDRGLVPDATPSLGFRKWVTTMLSTTQVGKNVILLALMFVYRLKKFNPSVSGKRGSEFRLLTIALMLGNKFLDDNTYTNKTWAEVSGISVQEIHIMEVEFLSNMRYELYASQAEWIRWKTLLGKFGAFYEKAARHPAHASPNHELPVTPTSQIMGHKLPSPPSKLYDAGLSNYNILPNPMTTVPQLPRSPARPTTLPFDRKRSIDAAELPPPAKRHHAGPSADPGPGLSSFHPLPAADHSVPTPGDLTAAVRMPPLPMPRMVPGGGSTMGTYLAPLAMPPARSMTSVYPVTSATWSHPSTPLSALPPTMNGPLHAMSFPTADAGRPSGAVVSAHTSPVNLYGPSTPTRPGLSPSYFLTNRSSPYRPVRNVHTLLIPPPSAALQTAVRNLPVDQMHYQPLGRPLSDRRVGAVPYLPQDSRQLTSITTPTDTLYRPF